MLKLMKNIFIISLLLLMIYFTAKLLKSEYFNVVDVKIEGTYKITNKDIVENLNKLKGSNILYLNSHKLEKAIEEDVRIEKVTVSKVYPSKIIIKITEKAPYIYIRKKDKFFIADKKLNIFGSIYEMELQDIPIINLTDNARIEELKVIMSQIGSGDIYTVISEIRKKDNYYELKLKDGIIIKTDTLVSANKYKTSYAVYNRIKNIRPIEYIEIRFKDFDVK